MSETKPCEIRPWHSVTCAERRRLESELAAAQEKALLYDLDKAGIDARNKEAVELVELRAQLAAAKEWREAVLNELIVAHIYTKDHDTNPRKAVQDAIIWNCQVALDPLISSDARALIAKAEAERDAAMKDAERWRFMFPDPRDEMTDSP